ncbi:PIN domain-containing protein [Candidatus Desantisbacteria bacterium]|nr:PIN domain-containing protein [Candidatus Desantisbacteria bacterium]
MTLTDTGPLVALLDKNDHHHDACVKALKYLPFGPLLTTWPCFTEAMYLLGEVGGYRYQVELWKLISIQRLVLHDLTTTEIESMSLLMEKYQDTPMDLADASLVVVAQQRSLRRIFTLDRDFYIYRLADGSVIDVLP